MLVKLNIKAMVRVEAMLNRPFSDLDYNNQDDVDTLLYCCALSTGSSIPFDIFKIVLKNKQKREEMLQGLAMANSVTSLFSPKEEKTGEHRPQWVKDLVATLISEGIDVSYLLNEIELSELPLLIKGVELKRMNRMESERLWTFFTISPHIDIKKGKIKSPEDMFPFPWESEQRKKKAEKEIAENKAEFEAFMSGKFNHIMKN